MMRNKTDDSNCAFSPSPTRLLGGLCVALCLVIVALGAYIAVLKNEEKDTMIIVDTQSEVLQVYPDFFRTDSQQEQYEKSYFSSSNITVMPEVKTEPTLESPWQVVCNTTRSPPGDKNLSRKRRSAKRRERTERANYKRYIESDKFHGCCTSRRRFISPDSAVSDDYGDQLELVHFDGQRQYFLSQDCWHNSGCKLFCGCRQQIGLYRALVINPDYEEGGLIPRYIVRTIRIPGGCKCMNGLSPPFWM